MKHVVVRGTTITMLVFSLAISALFVGFSVLSLYILSPETVPFGVHVFLYVIILVFLFTPGILYGICTVISYLKQVRVIEDKIVFIHPFKKKKVIFIKEISVWGYAAFAPRSTMLYFCSANLDEIFSCLESSRNTAMRLFGESKAQQMMLSSEGTLQIAVGIYLYKSLFHPSNDVFILDHYTSERVEKLQNAMKQDALVTGPWLLK